MPVSSGHMTEDDFTPPSPIPNSYWVMPGRLLAGEHPSGTSRSDSMVRLKRLLDAGVTSFLDLTEEDELPSYHTMLPELTEQPIRYRRLSITDHSVPESAGRMSDILDHLHAELAANRCVYVHCRAGIGRTGTTIACHLIRAGRAHEDALAHLQQLWRQCDRSRNWPTVPETEEQIAFVRAWRDRTAGVQGDIDERARYEGAFVGLGIGDALGSLVYASAFDASTLVARAREVGVLVPGADTGTTRAVAESLIACGGHEPRDQLARYVEWSRSTDALVPPELKRALAAWQWSKKLNAGTHDPKNLDPHTLARTLAPALYSAGNAAAALELAAEVSRTTQQSPVVLDLCRLWCALLLDAANGASKAMLASCSGAAGQLVRRRALKPQVRALLDQGSPTRSARASDALEVTQHAIDSFAATASFRDAILRCVAQGRAVASAAALCGALAGAHYGIDAIPSEWRAKLADEPVLRSLARHLSA